MAERLNGAGEFGSTFGYLYLAGGALAEFTVRGAIAGYEAANFIRRLLSAY
jgi:hypothetical protein